MPGSLDVLPEDEDDVPTVLVPEDLRVLLPKRQGRVRLRARYRADGVVYARADTHAGNSLIFYYPSLHSSPVAGSIQYIFLRDGRYYFAVRQQAPLLHQAPDPFSKYPDFPAKLYSSALSTTLEEVSISSVIGHYARFNFGGLAVVLKLSRVRICQGCLMHLPYIFRRSECTSSIFWQP